jgi:hypothetical protein
MLLLLALLLTACQGSDEDNSSPDDCYLDIYVYAPDRPIVTRSDVGEIPPSNDAEKKVNTLQVWVFKSNGGAKVGYLNDTKPTYLNETNQQKYRMKVAKEFADHPEAVDVYVVANAETCGLDLSESSTRKTLDDAVIGKDSPVEGECYFSPAEKQSSVPSKGLPMSAILKNQSISGSFPALRIGSETEMTTLKLTRAVSKLRFVLCRKDDTDATKQLQTINTIELNGGQIPLQTFLMPGTTGYTNFKSDKTDKISYLTAPLLPNDTDIPKVEDPLVYAYETQTAQEYEELINDAVSKGKLNQLGLTYLRESDLQLKGNINYTYRDGSTDNTVDTEFSMAAPGDFLRNHSWIIYIFYMDTKIHVQVVTDIGMRSWIPDGRDESVIVHNW